MMTIIFTTLLMLGSSSVPTTTVNEVNVNDVPAAEEDVHEYIGPAIEYDGSHDPVCLACRG